MVLLVIDEKEAREGRKMTEHIRKTIEETNTLFQALQTVGNEAHRQVGYNKPYEFSPGLTATL